MHSRLKLMACIYCLFKSGVSNSGYHSTISYERLISEYWNSKDEYRSSRGQIWTIVQAFLWMWLGLTVNSEGTLYLGRDLIPGCYPLDRDLYFQSIFVFALGDTPHFTHTLATFQAFSVARGRVVFSETKFTSYRISRRRCSEDTNLYSYLISKLFPTFYSLLTMVK